MTATSLSRTVIVGFWAAVVLRLAWVDYRWWGFVVSTLVLVLVVAWYHRTGRDPRALPAEPQKADITRETWVAAWAEIHAFEADCGHPAYNRVPIPAYASPAVTPEQAEADALSNPAWTVQSPCCREVAAERKQAAARKLGPAPFRYTGHAKGFQ
jgi:hypothetical protein